ncbi:MAG: 3-hydroxyacyl-CoA dehydrogenase, partial [Nocardioidaceae bacterium]
HTLMWHIREQTVADLRDAGQPVEGNRLVDHPAFALLDTFVHELGRSGRTAGAGFYEYPEQGRKFLWPELVARYHRPDVSMAEDEIADRLTFAQVIDTARCLEEGIVTSVADANIGSILGIGFPAWTGGALQFVNAYGTPAFVARADRLAASYGARFDVPELLRAKAASGERF